MDDLNAALARLQVSLSGEALQRCTEAAAAPILREAERLAPVGATRAVEDGLEAVSTHTATSATTAVQVAGSGPGGEAHEAVFLEYGTSRMPAEPFMRPAFESAKDEAVRAFENALSAQLNLS
jgi:HK97 gp10 family phage protein